MSKRIIRERVSQAPQNDLPHQWHPVVRRVLVNRGIGTETMMSTRINQLHPASQLNGLNEAAKILMQAMLDDKQIRVVGDYDADGATATAVVIRAMNLFAYAKVDYVVPNRFEFGYGLSPELIESFQKPNPDVLITVDNGISSVTGVDRAKGLGMKVIITDHHLPGEVLPDADAIVNPNVRGDVFPSKNLAGVGVAFYLMVALKKQLEEGWWFKQKNVPVPDLRKLLDLVALGTVADLVPLDSNNRILVSQGLALIRQEKACEGILALLKIGKRDSRFADTADLGFAVAPRLNAAGRLDDISEGIQCLISDDPLEARYLAQGLDAINQERKQIQLDMQQQANDMVNESLVDGLNVDRFMVVFHESWHPGVVGLIASKIKETYHRPVLAFAPASENSDELKGSGRSISGFHFRDFLAEIENFEPGLMQKFGGHAMAAGLSISRSKFPHLKQVIHSLAEKRISNKVLERVVETDGSLDTQDHKLSLAQTLGDLLPWGQLCPAPVFEGEFSLIDKQVMAGKHLRLYLRHVQGGPELEAVAFNQNVEQIEGCRRLNLLYRLDVNRFRGRARLQLLVEEILN